MFVIVGGLLVAVLMALLLAPLFIDWTTYRADFEREASKILGRPVKVAGDASARILPFPSLSFSNVRVGEDIENPALTIERFSMDAELAPFMSGEVLIYDMRVTKPRGVVVLDKNGLIDWTLRPSSPFNPGNVRIERMLIEGGQFDLVDQAAGRTHSIVLPQAVISARALIGPWRMTGMTAIDGEPVHLTITTGQAEKGVLPLRVTALPTARAVVIESDGSARSEGGKASYAGQFTLRPAMKSDYAMAQIKAAGKVVDNEAGALFKVTGKFGLAPTGLALTAFKLETGARENPYVANGSGSMIFGSSPMFDLKLDGTQVNFANDASAGVGSELASRIETFRQFINTVPMPDMPGSIDVNLPAIVAGDTTVRDVAFTATPENGAWRVRNFKSTLPGRTQLEADGLLTRGEAFGFVGKLLVASNQPAGLANWLTGQVDPAIRKLSAIGFSSEVDLKPVAQSFGALELALGDAIFTGSAQRRSDGQRPILNLTLTGGALDLDSLNALGQGFIGADGGNRFVGHDVSLTLDVGPVLQSGLEAVKLGLSLRIKANEIEIDRLMLTNIAGASVSATGKITDPGAAFSGNFDISLISANGSEFVKTLAQRFPSNAFFHTLAARIDAVPQLLDDLNSTMIASTAKDGDARSVTISLNAKTSTGVLAFAGNAKGVDAATLAGSFRGNLREEDPLALVALAGVPVLPLLAQLGAPGPGVVEFSGAGDLHAGLATSVKFNAAGTDAGFEGTLKLGETGLIVSGNAKLASDDFDPYLTATGLVYSGVGTGTSLKFKSGIQSSVGALVFSGIDGAVLDNKFTGDIKLKFAERPAISGAIKSSRLDLLWFGENLFGTGAFDALDANIGATAFSTQPVAPFDGRIEFQSDVLLLGSLGKAQDAKGAVDLTASAIRFENLSGAYLGGNLTATLDMRNDGGAGAISGNFSLQGGKSTDIALLKPVIGAIDLSGSVTASGKTLEGLTAGLTGSGIAAIRDGVVPGFNPDGFAGILASLSTRESAPTLPDVEAMIAASVLEGRFLLQPDNLAWSIAGGTLRMSGIKGVASGAVLNAEINADLTDGSAAVAGTIVYDAGKESVVGAEPVVPFLAIVSKDQASLTADAQPMLQYLTQGALEREQARVEALQSALVEKQRLRRDVRLIGLMYSERDRRALLRETAIRTEAARKGAVLAGQWGNEKVRLQEERLRLQAEAKAAAAREKAAKAKADQELRPFEPASPDNKSLEDVFKSLQFDLN